MASDEKQEMIDYYKNTIVELRQRNDTLEKENLEQMVKNNKLVEMYEDLKNQALRQQQEYYDVLNFMKKQYQEGIKTARKKSRYDETIKCLSENNGNIIKTAADLGISRQALYKRLKSAQ